VRKQFVKSATKLLDEDPNRVLLLGDIGVYGFREAFEKFPDRVYNAGILEQSIVGMAAGMSLAGMKPIVHTIAPFLVERAYEQLKIDFGYQHLAGTFVGVGGSYDCSTLGCTHHCPGDVSLLENIGFQIFVPGHPGELDMIFERTKNWQQLPVYIRMSEHSNSLPVATDIQQFFTIKFGTNSAPTVVAVGPCLDMVIKACHGLDATVVYTTTVVPHDYNFKLPGNDTVIVVEPYYSSQIGHVIALRNSTKERRIHVRNFCPSRRFVEIYGSTDDLNKFTGFTTELLRKEIEQWHT
jgi:transketolase